MPRHRVTIAPHLASHWDSVAVDDVPVGNEPLSFVIRRGRGAISIQLRRSRGGTPLDVEFAPAPPLGARVAMPAASQRTPGDVHARVVGRVVDTVERLPDGVWGCY